jgi:imidazolonepropionase-like amidohydrolase
MGDADVYYANQDIRKTIDKGIFIGPRLTGPAITSRSRAAAATSTTSRPSRRSSPTGSVVDGPEEIRKAVRQEIKYGSDWIKLLVTGAYKSVGDDPRNVAFSPEEIKARRRGESARRSVAAHAHATEGIKQASPPGVRSIEHGTFIDDEGIRMMVEHGTFLVPTIYVGDYYAEGDKLRAPGQGRRLHQEHAGQVPGRPSAARTRRA